MQRAHAVVLFRREDLALEGIGGQRLKRMVHSGELVVVRPGVYVWAHETEALNPEERVVVRARALTLVSRAMPLFSHLTAAAIHGLPLYGERSRALHVISPEGRPTGAGRVIRHRGDVPDDQRIIVAGLLCTTLDRTVADVARTAPYATSVCVADAALGSLAYLRAGVYLLERAEEFRGTVRDIAERSAHGVARARRVVEFADGRAQLPGESVSRIHLAQLGFAPPRLQVRVTGPDGRDDFIDFGLDDVDALGEFDGKGKYHDPTLRGARTPAQVLDEEKQREDWIRGRTQRRFARWGSEHNRTALTLGTRLASFGIIPPGR